MKWQIFHRTLDGQYIHLRHDRCFVIGKNQIVFGNHEQYQILENAENWPEEKARLVRAIRMAKFRSSAAACARWIIIGGITVSVAMMFNGTLLQNSLSGNGIAGQGFPSAEQPMPLYQESGPNASLNTGPSLQQPPHMPPQSKASTSVPDARAKQIAAALQQGAQSTEYTVSYGPEDAEHTLYVFADPLCPHCRDLEPALHELADRGVRVEIFPVSVIGRDRSVNLIASTMCQPSGEKRQQSWMNATTGTADPFSKQGEPCTTGHEALKRNNKFFAVAHLSGTPALFNAAGQQAPETGPLNADTLYEWLQQ